MYLLLKLFDTKFKTAGTSPTCELDVKGLTPNKKYKFRVRAVNKEGESPDLEGDDQLEVDL